MAVLEIDDDLIAKIKERVDAGKYPSTLAVIGEALQLLEEREKLLYLQELLAEADAEIDRGEFVEWTPTFMSDIVQDLEEKKRRGIEIEADPDVVG